MKIVIPMSPQPTRERDGWLYGGSYEDPTNYYASDDQMQSHLFHNVYGEKGSPLGSVYADHSDVFYIQGVEYAVKDVAVELDPFGKWVWAITAEKTE